MGYHVAYAAFRGMDVSELLTRLSLADTGKDDPYNETPMSGAMLSTGWYLIWSNDLNWGWQQENLFTRLSVNCDILVSIAEETTMTFLASGFSKGKKAWTIFHDGQAGVDHLETEGRLPPTFNEIYERNAALQKTEGDSDPYGVDYYASIPPEVVSSICGFQYDVSQDEPVKFTALVEK